MILKFTVPAFVASHICPQHLDLNVNLLNTNKLIYTAIWNGSCKIYTKSAFKSLEARYG
jgi:hypothetical protein